MTETKGANYLDTAIKCDSEVKEPATAEGRNEWHNETNEVYGTGRDPAYE